MGLARLKDIYSVQLPPGSFFFSVWKYGRSRKFGSSNSKNESRGRQLSSRYNTIASGKQQSTRYFYLIPTGVHIHLLRCPEICQYSLQSSEEDVAKKHPQPTPLSYRKMAHQKSTNTTQLTREAVKPHKTKLKTK